MKLHKSRMFAVMAVITIVLVLSACSPTAQNETSDGFFQHYFVIPFIETIHFGANLLGGSYGGSIIVITLIIRLILMPFNLKVVKNQQQMKAKMDVMKPELEEVQKKLKETQDKTQKMKLQQEMVALYQKHGVNPLQMGCLPLLLQMPILIAFYYAIRGSEEIASHTFLWFNLGTSDIWMTILAGAIYLVQFKVSQMGLPQAQQNQMKFIGLLSPIMIVIISLNAPAVLPLYWAVGGLFIIGQTWLARRLYQNHREGVVPQ